jgi:histone H3/H4
MFTSGLVLDNIYANVDAVDQTKQRRCKQALNAALHDIIEQYAWPGYRTTITLETDASGVFYLPSDLARQEHCQVRDSAGTYLGRAKSVDRDMVRESRYQDFYRVLVTGNTTDLFNRGTNPVSLTYQSAALTGASSGDFSINIDTAGGWVLLDGESAPRKVTNNASPQLAQTYWGWDRQNVTFFVNPNRKKAELFVPSSIKASETSAGHKVDLVYTRYSEDIVYDQQPIELPNLECLEAAATARILRQDRRRDDADRWKSDAREALLEAMEAAMDYTLEHSYGPEYANGKSLNFGKNDSGNEELTESPIA